jgi:hypothetical protein
MPPTTAKEWIAVANERAADAEAIKKAIKKEKPSAVGSVYMAGYTIECSLKALLQSRGTPFPKHGQEGHNLHGLWEASKFKLSDLSDEKGTKTFFIEHWNTALRYEISCESTLEVAELVDGARQLTGWIQSKLRRQLRKRR